MTLGSASAGNDGHWGPITATLDWCEENYIVSNYIAEWCNSMSNASYLVLALIGMWSCYQVKAEPRLYACFGAIAFIGFGSFAFHSTLTYTMQLSDELPMIYGTCFFVYVLLQMWPPEKNGLLLVAALTFYSVAVTAIYIAIRVPLFHQVAYAFLTLFTIILPAMHVSKVTKTYPNDKHRLWTAYWFSLIGYLAGFICWNLDNLYCDQLRSWRNDVGYPLRFVGEFHSWWHFLTAFGTYGAGQLTLILRMRALGRPTPQLAFVGLFPIVFDSAAPKAGKRSVLDKEKVVNSPRRSNRLKAH